MEAVAAGCLPAVPDDLAYPEFYPGQFRYRDGAAEAVKLIRSLRAGLRAGTVGAPDLSAWSPAQLGECYRREFLAAAGVQDSQ